MDIQEKIDGLQNRIEKEQQSLEQFIENANRQIVARENRIVGLRAALAWLEVGDFDGIVVDQIGLPSGIINNNDEQAATIEINNGATNAPMV